jgi:CBS domain-containing protein
MQVSEVMSGEVNIANPQQSIREAAQMMAAIDSGVLPVGENDRLVGMITDRDIAVRAVAAGKGPDSDPRGHEHRREILFCR